jgi:methanethiol S-methyltransferase
VAYPVLLASSLYAIGLVGNLFLPATIDSGQLGPPIPAIGIDLALLSLFAVQHSAMPARDAAIIQDSAVGEPR